MKKAMSSLLFTLLLGVGAFAHQPFTLISSQTKTVKEPDLSSLEKSQTVGKKDKTNLSFTEKEIRLVVTTGPEDDMLSYWIQGARNPNLVVPSGATLKILFVNADVDMRHDVRFGHVGGEFPIAPDIKETAGSTKLTAKTEDGTLQAEELVIKTSEDGAYKYFCSVRGHAKGGMWSNILVGVKPGADLKTPEKTKHVHSPDEDKDHPHDEKIDTKKTDAKSKEKKPEEMSEMNHEQDKKTNHQHNGKEQNMAEMNHGEMEMRSTVDLNDPMTRESSGTAWTADSSPMYARMKTFGDGSMLMFHGNVFGRYTRVGSTRDVSVGGKGARARFDAPSMFMAMYSRPLGKKAQLGLRAMVSLDPIIERGYGYPLLYQSGETYGGEPIHDRQHPHDFFSELSASVSYKINENQSVYFYAGYPGEPALGPPAFMHRASAMDNPDAPISHHWQDATHITWGVVTAGYSFGKFKFEASAFKGEEPDENRWNFDKPKLDSYSGRFSWNPTREWAFQVSHGRLKNPEPSEPELESLRRTTASAIYNKSFADDRNWANSFVWGQNRSDEGATNAFLFESAYQFRKNTVFGRAERVQKDSHELSLPAPHPDGNFWVGAYSVGYVRDLFRNQGLDFGVGAAATFNTNPAIISDFYGGTRHGGWQIFFRVRPSKMKHG